MFPSANVYMNAFMCLFGFSAHTGKLNGPACSPLVIVQSKPKLTNCAASKAARAQ